MKVYVVEHFVAYESIIILKVFDSQIKALKFISECREEKNKGISEILKNGYVKKDDEYWHARWERLPTGWKWNDECWIYTVMVVE